MVLRKSTGLKSIFKFFLIIFFLAIFLLLFREKCKVESRVKKAKGKICSHYDDLGRDAVRFLTEWECNYCGKVIDWGGSHPKPNQSITRSVLNSLAEKHLQKCKIAQEFFAGIDSKNDDSSVFDNEEILKKKGYEDVDKIKNLGLMNRINLPDLKAEKRCGVVKELVVIGGKVGESNSQEIIFAGNVLEELVFLAPRATPIHNFTEIFRLFKKSEKFFFPCGKGKKNNEYERIIVGFFIWRILQKERVWNYNVFSLLVNTHKFMPISGESGTLPFYLALLSAYYKKPISRKVASSGFLNIGNYSELNYCPWCLNSEIEKDFLQQHKIISVSDLEYKIPIAVMKFGVRKLILSAGQQENYEKVVPQEIREKLKVYYVENVEELEELFWQGEFS